MRKTRAKSGLTLLEMLTVVVIVAVLAAMVIGLTGRFEQRNKEGQVHATFSTLNAALEQFADYRFRYKGSDYEDFRFPLDCGDLVQGEVDAEDILTDVLGPTVVIDGVGDPNWLGIEVMHFLLSRVPECRETLGKIDRGFVTNKDVGNTSVPDDDRTITVDSRREALFRILDPWDGVLRYDYYDEKKFESEWFESRRSFPVVTSAGLDGEFDTDDDISSREF
jgi:prepilin-type N-terminal cleavage/methylation domain-containing protein